jgi:hypothetical protein
VDSVHHRTAVKIVNQTEWTICALAYGNRDSDWNNLNTSDIEPGHSLQVASIGDPGSAERDHWGRVFVCIKHLKEDEYIYAKLYIRGTCRTVA